MKPVFTIFLIVGFFGSLRFNPKTRLPYSQHQQASFNQPRFWQNHRLQDLARPMSRVQLAEVANDLENSGDHLL
jgi:hypothetical protein